jgi:hypothetical protein
VRSFTDRKSTPDESMTLVDEDATLRAMPAFAAEQPTERPTQRPMERDVEAATAAATRPLADGGLRGVVGLFPKDGAVVRLDGALMIEISRQRAVAWRKIGEETRARTMHSDPVRGPPAVSA